MTTVQQIVIQMTKHPDESRTVKIHKMHFEDFMRLLDAGGKQFGAKVIFEEVEDKPKEA